MTKPIIHTQYDDLKLERRITLIIPDTWFVDTRRPHWSMIWWLLKMWWEA